MGLFGLTSLQPIISFFLTLFFMSDSRLAVGNRCWADSGGVVCPAVNSERSHSAGVAVLSAYWRGRLELTHSFFLSSFCLSFFLSFCLSFFLSVFLSLFFLSCLLACFLSVCLSFFLSPLASEVGARNRRSSGATLGRLTRPFRRPCPSSLC